MPEPRKGRIVDGAEVEQRRHFRRRLLEAYRAWEAAAPGRDRKRLAEALGAPQSSVSEWLAEEKQTMPEAKYILRLPAVLGVDGHWLLTGEGEMRPLPRSEAEERYYAIARIVSEGVTAVASAAELSSVFEGLAVIGPHLPPAAGTDEPDRRRVAP